MISRNINLKPKKPKRIVILGSKGFIASAILSFIGIYLVIEFFVGMDAVFTYSGGNFTSMDIFLCSIVGLVVTALFIWVFVIVVFSL